jgi:uncharacterized protein YpmS
MKKGWKIFLFIILVIFIILILGILYFLFIFKFPGSAVCLSETDVVNSPITCTSKQECDSALNETMTEVIETYATGPNEELYRKFLGGITEKMIYCDSTCKIKRTYKLDSPDDPCIGNDEKIAIKLTGIEGLRAYSNVKANQ